MAQVIIGDSQDSIENEELFIEETAKLAQLVFEQKEKEVVFYNECYVTGKGAGTAESSLSQDNSASKELMAAATDVGELLRGISVKYNRQLTDEFDRHVSNAGTSLWDINYNAFSTICNNLLQNTLEVVGNRWNQTLLVFAGYMHLREAMRNDLHQHEISSYIGRYLSDMGFQSWIQLQGGWQHVGVLRQDTDNSPICPPAEGTAV